MLKIGDFSSLAQVSIKTLRHYDQTGLLTPANVDPATGYRYYAVAQLSRLHRILALKDLGFSLHQISKLLHDGVTVEQVRGMLLLRQAEQHKQVEDERSRLSRVNTRIRLIEQENQMKYEVVLKSAPKQWIASVREIISTYSAVGMLYGKIAQVLEPAMENTVMSVALWHDPEYKDRDVDAEAGFYLRNPISSANGVQVYELAGTTVASTIHAGSYLCLPQAYDALLRWVADSGYGVSGPIRELYLQCTLPVRMDDESYVTEIQVPVSLQNPTI